MNSDHGELEIVTPYVFVCVCICKHLQPWTNLDNFLYNRGHTPTVDVHDCQRPAIQ